MDVDCNKAVASLLVAMGDADLVRANSLTTEVPGWCMAPSTILSGTYGKPAWLDLFRGLFDSAAGPMVFSH